MELTPHRPERDEVYESFGEASPLTTPAAASSPPPGLPDLETHPLAAVEAFETFMGRRYDPAELGVTADGQLLRQDIFGPVALHASGRIGLLSKSLEAGLRQQQRGGGRGAAAPSLASAALESPLQRFSRLSEEVRCLQEELSVVAAADGAAPAAGGGVWEALVQGTRSLESQLAALAPSLAVGQLAASRAATAAGGSDGAGWYEAALARLHTLGEADGATAEGGAEDLPLPPSRRGEREELQLLDARMAALEAVLLPSPLPAAAAAAAAAGQAPPRDGGGSIMGRIDALEAAVARLTGSPQALTDLGMRAAAAATALRQVQVAAAAGGAEATSQHGAYVLTGERVMRAVEALERWDAWAPALPVLATRLATLERVHRDAALFTQRLALAEAALGAVEVQVSAGAELVAGAQEGLRAAAKDMAENVRAMQMAANGR